MKCNLLLPAVIVFLALALPVSGGDLPRVDTRIDRMDLNGEHYSGRYLGCNFG
ncbi:MAG: hypothetical protein RDV48_29030 [Candidatus Eremiobacteraeota bacterium]|nr:hypothetical protein [Candidatus Eremiobacteraeota bacterium]